MRHQARGCSGRAVPKEVFLARESSAHKQRSRGAQKARRVWRREEAARGHGGRLGHRISRRGRGRRRGGGAPAGGTSSLLGRYQLQQVGDGRAAAACARTVRLRVGGLLEVELASEKVAVAEAVPAEVGLLRDARRQHEACACVEESIKELCVDLCRGGRELGGVLREAVLLPKHEPPG